MIKRLFRLFSGFAKLREENGPTFDGYPVIHHFPEVGKDGEVTLNLTVTPSAGSSLYDFVKRQELNSGIEEGGVTSVGALFVELDKLGLRLRWKPAQLSEKSVLSPFGMAPLGPVLDLHKGKVPRHTEETRKNGGK